MACKTFILQGNYVSKEIYSKFQHTCYAARMLRQVKFV